MTLTEKHGKDQQQQYHRSMGDISTEHKTPTNRCKRSGRKRVTCGAKRKRLAVHCGTLKQKQVVLMMMMMVMVVMMMMMVVMVMMMMMMVVMVMMMMMMVMMRMKMSGKHWWLLMAMLLVWPFIAWNSNDLTATSLFSDGEWFRLVNYCTIFYYVYIYICIYKYV